MANIDHIVYSDQLDVIMKKLYTGKLPPEQSYETDICFVFVEHERVLHAHKLILSIRSPVLNAMINDRSINKGDRIEIDDIHPDVFNDLLR